MAYLNVLTRAAKSPVIDYHLILLKNSKLRANFFNTTIKDILADLAALEEVLKDFECRYASLTSETIYQKYMNGEEPEDDSFVLDFGSWASTYQMWLDCQTEYHQEIRKFAQQSPELTDSLRLAA